VTGDPQFGPNSVILDTATNLEWLRLRFTYDQSIASVLANPRFDRFGYADETQFGTLFTDYGLPNPGPFTAAELSGFLDFVYGASPAPLIAQGWLGPILPDPPNLIACNVEFPPLNGPSQLFLAYQCDEAGTGFSNNVASFLIRPAPEPASITLLAGALLLIFGLWRRRYLA